MRKTIHILIIFLILFLLNNVSSGQESNTRTQNFQPKENLQSLFSNIENGIKTGDVNSLVNSLSSQTYLNLSNGVSGYYSSNQAYYVLEDFFKVYHIISFKYSRIQTDEINPFAIGSYKYEYKGKRDAAQVYISLKKVGNTWKITQITID